MLSGFSIISISNTYKVTNPVDNHRFSRVLEEVSIVFVRQASNELSFFKKDFYIMGVSKDHLLSKISSLIGHENWISKLNTMFIVVFIPVFENFMRKIKYPSYWTWRSFLASYISCHYTSPTSR